MDIRKTHDEIQIQEFYHGEWRTKFVAESRSEARRLIIEYKVNCPSSLFRVKTVRIKNKQEELKMTNKIKALADFLGESVENLKDNGDNYVQVIDGMEYLILTDGEANEKAKDYIEDSLWAFNAEFILDTCGLDSSSNVIESLRKMQEASCEGCNDFIHAIVDWTCGIDEFVAQAIIGDGRGHFLSTYDGKEGEQDGYFIYCIG